MKLNLEMKRSGPISDAGLVRRVHLQRNTLAKSMRPVLLSSDMSKIQGRMVSQTVRGSQFNKRKTKKKTLKRQPEITRSQRNSHTLNDTVEICILMGHGVKSNKFVTFLIYKFLEEVKMQFKRKTLFV